MTIKTGEQVPSATLAIMGDEGPTTMTTDEIFAGKRVVLFALPGAFTPTCSARHLPGFVEKADEILAKGVDTIACMSVNDAFVMSAWGSAHSADNILMLADGNADFARALGLEVDLTARQMGVRSQRFAMVVDNGVVTHLAVEAPGKFEVSGADDILGQL